MNNVGAEAYRRQQIMTSSPEALTLMLYDGAIRFVRESILAIEKKDFKKAHTMNMRAQRIVREFMLTTDMKYEISKDWILIDEYILHRLVQGNIKKEIAQLEEAKKLLIEFRDTWSQAMQQVRINKSMGHGSMEKVEISQWKSG